MSTTNDSGAQRHSSAHEGYSEGHLEGHIDLWRTHLGRSRTISPADAEELEDHLREQVEGLMAGGLSTDEAFLVAVKRMGSIDALTHEFAQEHSERLWKQLVLSEARPDSRSAPSAGSRSLKVALGLAVAAGVTAKLPNFFGIDFDGPGFFYALNIAFFVLPFIAAYFIWDRRIRGADAIRIGALFAAALLGVSLLPAPAADAVGPAADARILTVLHLPIALWFAVGISYVGGRWLGNSRRMDFIRFTGELFIYYVLIALGGWVTVGLGFVLFEAIGIDIEPFFEQWIICAVVGAALVATWLVEAKQSVIENMAPVLARIFIPVLTLVLLAFVGTLTATGRITTIDRDLLFAMDLVLLVVFGLLLYSVSARDAFDPPNLFDRLRVALVVSALLVDALALWSIVTRISEFGFTPNRTAALGINLVLLVNLAGALLLQLRFIQGRAPLSRSWDWQVRYLYVLAGWATLVAFGFPLLFRG